jgi:hypothetical protein
MCPDVNGTQKSFYFLVCERFPLFAMLKNRCGKKRGKMRADHVTIFVLNPIYIIFQTSKVTHGNSGVHPANPRG